MISLRLLNTYVMPPDTTRYVHFSHLYIILYSLNEQIAFIGHSQGNGIAFVSLSKGMRPEVGAKLSCFVALAPAVFAGPLNGGTQGPQQIARRASRQIDGAGGGT